MFFFFVPVAHPNFFHQILPPPPFQSQHHNPHHQQPLVGYPMVTDIEDATEKNNYYRDTLWTGKHLQVTLMSIEPGEDIGLEVHPHGDQFIRIEDGKGLVKMGPSKNNLTYHKSVEDDDAIMIPAGTWHNVVNVGRKPLKLYAIYGPPEHAPGTQHKTKAIAEASEHHH